MKLQQQESYEVQDNMPNKSRVAVRIANIGHAMRVFAESTYARPIEAAVRETIANGIDASRGKQFEVTVPSLLDPNFKVRDYGVGMDEAFFTDGYAAVGFSTKRDSNDEIGGFGQGRFAAFAYQGCDCFYVKGYKDGKMFLGSVSRDADFNIFVQVEARSDTTEPNGVEVIMPVLVADHDKFQSAVQIFTEFLDPQPICAVERLERKTVFAAADGSWKISSFENYYDVQGEPIRAIMGGIPYKLDLSQVFGYDTSATMNIKAADLHFKIGELSVPASREELRYDDATKAAVKAKFKEIKVEIEALIVRLQASLTTQWQKWTDPSVLAYRKALGQHSAKHFSRNDIPSLRVLHDFKRVTEFSGRSSKIEESLQIKHDREYLIYLVDDEKNWRRKIALDATARVDAATTNHGNLIVVGSLAGIAALGDAPYIATSTLPIPPRMVRKATQINTVGGFVSAKHVPTVYDWDGSRWKENTYPDFTVQDRVYIPFKISKPAKDSGWHDVMWTDFAKTLVGVPSADLALAKKAGWKSLAEHVKELETPDRIEAMKYINSTEGLWRYPLQDLEMLLELGKLFKVGFKLPQMYASFGRKIGLVIKLKMEDKTVTSQLEKLSTTFRDISIDPAYDLTTELKAFREAHPFFTMILDAEIYSKALHEKKVDVPQLLAMAKKAL